MPTIDIILTCLIGFGIVKGLFKGLFVEVASLLALLLGAYGAIYFSNFTVNCLSAYLDWPEKTIGLTAFALTFIAILLGISMAGKALTKLASFASLGILNKILGGLFGGLKMALIASAILFAANSFNARLSLVSEDKIHASILYMPVQSLASKILPTFVGAGGVFEIPSLSPSESTKTP